MKIRFCFSGHPAKPTFVARSSEQKPMVNSGKKRKKPTIRISEQNLNKIAHF
jgi:hypothetical protein